MPELDEYKELIYQDPCYAWLVSRLRRKTTLSTTKSNTLGYMKIHLQNFLQTNSAFQEQVIEKSRMTFEIDWDILAFLHGQDYETPNEGAIAEVITLTGSEMRLQALSCGQYMEQVWPITGLQTLAMIQSLLSNQEHKTRLIC